jgi:DNA polymerase-1
MDKTTPYYRIQAGTSKRTVLILVEQPTESIVKMGAYKSKMFDDINKHVKTHLPKIQTYFTFAIHKHVEKIKIADIRADMNILSKTISAVTPTAIICMGRDSKRALEEISWASWQGTVPEIFYCGSWYDNAYVEDTFTRVYHELKNTLNKVPITQNLSSIVLQSNKYKELAIDFEWNPDTGVPHSVGLAAGNVCGGFILTDQVKQIISNAVRDKNMTVVGHNITSDCAKIIEYIGNNIECKFMDTLLLKRELDYANKNNGLKYLADRYLLLENYWRDITVEDFSNPSPKLLRYTAGDAWATLCLWTTYYEEYQQDWTHMEVARRLDMEMVLPVAYMMHGGIKLDKKQLVSQRKKLQKEQINLLEYFETKYDINPSSPLQVLEVLRKKHKVKSTGVSVLSKLNTEFSEKILQYRKVTKLLTTYLDKIPQMADDQNVLRCTLHLGGTVTGRMSSSNPNMQNIPPSVRPIFQSVFEQDGTLITVDASQSELRCLAYLSNSQYLIDAYNQGKDMHTLVSELAGIERKNAKTLNFAYVYGSSEFGLINQLIMSGVPKASASTTVKLFMDTMSQIGIAEYQRKLIDKAKKLGYIYSPYGRVGTRLKTTQVVNYPIQSFSADLNKQRIIQMFELLKKYRLKSRIWLEFHDAMELDVLNSELEIVRELLHTQIKTAIPDVLGKGINLNLPLDVKEHGVNWE